MSPAVAARYPLSVVGNPHNQFSFVNALVRLRGGEAAIPRLRRDIVQLTGRSDIDIWDLPQQYADAQRQIAFEARCLVALAAAAFLASRATLAAGRRRVPVRGSATAAAAARAGFPVPVVVGARFALEPGRGPSAVPVRPAQIGAVAGVLGIVAAFTFAYGVSDTVAHPERFGQTFQVMSETGLNGTDFGS